MIVIGRYMLLIISLSGLTLSVGNRFSEDGELFFNGAQKTRKMDLIASQKIDKLDNETYNVNDLYGVVYNTEYYNNSTQLDVPRAMECFAFLYEQGNFYDYSSEPKYDYACDFTQIVWQATTHIGLTFRYESVYNRYKVLAAYYPRGNIDGVYILNIKRPTNIQPVTDPDIAGLIYQTEKEKFIDNLLKLHNQARTNHSVGPLRHDPVMDDLANSVLMKKKEIGNEYGMNWHLQRSFRNLTLGDEAAAKIVFSTWYKRENLYKYHSEISPTETEPFAQIVWQNTQQIGIGIRQEIGNQYEFLVLYKPPGNIPRQYRSNVFKPLSRDQGESSGNN